ncbi:hypothetical protein [Umezawaea sp. Da 62-37]|uniref:hypothetical protein n=1 Tax=Umezawaea sp. Da 62-37 TaxID=3075927 RepID=UPI0028F74495|nr:hypothetical protein [Umezawaea sp. Da 62-37]WNV83119.1 hypothetical protein RM788_33700 [Umezawaea sp. Da 62-37]
MPESGQPDIIDRIDALTDDAATWSAGGEHTHTWWATATEGAIAAVELSTAGLGSVELSETEPDGDIARRIGDPGVDRISPLYRVQFWVGGNSMATCPVNTGATTFLHRLLIDVRDGDYVASDAEREHARTLLDTPDTLPMIHGPCLITGVGEDSSAGPLEENFQGWFTTLLDQLVQMRHELLDAIAREIGVPADRLGGLVFLSLD